MPSLQIANPTKPAPFLFGAGTNEQQVFQNNAQLLAGQFGGLPISASGPRLRADTPGTLQAGVEPLLSFAVLELGTPQHTVWPGSIIAPDILKSSWIMNYWSWTGTPQLEIGEEGLKRAFRANRRRVEFTGGVTPTRMTRRGVETPLDVDEIAIADSQLQMSAHATVLARDMVMLAEEFEKQQLFGVAASYPVSHSVDLTGSEWDAVGGDSLTDIDTAVNQLETANAPYQRESIHLVMTRGARDAAIADPTYAALANGPVSRGLRPTTADLAAYWDVGQVSIADVVFDDGTGTVASMWGDTVILFIDPRLQRNLVSEWGRATFGITFRFQGAVISAPYMEPRPTSIIFPFDSYAHPAMIQGAAGYILTNVRA